jgi:putative Mn2+ efflux pump MntP
MVQLRGVSAILLGVSISLDELAIGFTLGLLRLPAALVIVLIALQAFIVTQLGLRLGHRLSDRLREGAERLAGLAFTVLALVLLGGKILS